MLYQVVSMTNPPPVLLALPGEGEMTMSEVMGKMREEE